MKSDLLYTININIMLEIQVVIGYLLVGNKEMKFHSKGGFFTQEK
jgi:hypothetical protein